ncbi:dentin sialophosphoprotein-like [Lytechinus pictus]|uniref:dentin sialophosphoprotein-like n=1 Tax=Lytechinus pictus TaxID=7653 RepID=UPI0030BA1CFB
MGFKATPLVTILILTVVSARLIKNHAESVSKSDSRGDGRRWNKVLNPIQLWVDKDKREVVPDVAITGTAKAVPDADVTIQSHSDHGEEDYPPFPDGDDIDTSNERNGVDTTSRSMESDNDRDTDDHSKDTRDKSDDDSDSSESSAESDSGSRQSRKVSKESGNDSRLKRGAAYRENHESSHSGVSESDSNSRQMFRRQADDVSNEEDDDSNSRLKRSTSNEQDNSADSRYRRNAIDVSRSNSGQVSSADDDSADSRQKKEIHESGDDDEEDNSDEQTQRDNARPVEPPTIGAQP